MTINFTLAKDILVEFFKAYRPHGPSSIFIVGETLNFEGVANGEISGLVFEMAELKLIDIEKLPGVIAERFLLTRLSDDVQEIVPLLADPEVWHWISADLNASASSTLNDLVSVAMRRATGTMARQPDDRLRTVDRAVVKTATG